MLHRPAGPVFLVAETHDLLMHFSLLPGKMAGPHFSGFFFCGRGTNLQPITYDQK